MVSAEHSRLRRAQKTPEPRDQAVPGANPLVHSSLVYTCSVVSDSLRPHGLYPSGSSVHGILQARTLEWVAMPSSGGSSWLRNQSRIWWVLYQQRCLGSPVRRVGECSLRNLWTVFHTGQTSVHSHSLWAKLGGRWGWEGPLGTCDVGRSKRVICPLVTSFRKMRQNWSTEQTNTHCLNPNQRRGFVGGGSSTH